MDSSCLQDKDRRKTGRWDEWQSTPDFIKSRSMNYTFKTALMWMNPVRSNSQMFSFSQNGVQVEACWTCDCWYKLGALICCYDNLRAFGKTFHELVLTRLQGFTPFSRKSMSEVRHGGWVWGRAHSKCCRSSQRCLMGSRSGKSSSSTTNSEYHDFMYSWFCESFKEAFHVFFFFPFENCLPFTSIVWESLQQFSCETPAVFCGLKN